MAYDVFINKDTDHGAYISATGPNGQYEEAHNALEKALLQGEGRATFTRGLYLFNDATVWPGNDSEIILQPGATLKTNHAGEVGILHLTGNNVHVYGGGRFLCESFKQNQTLVRFEGGIDPVAKNLHFEWTDGDDDNNNFMTALSFVDCVNVRSSDCVVYPMLGVQGFLGERMDGFQWVDNVVRVKDSRTPTSGAPYTECFRPFYLYGCQFGDVVRPVAYGLGSVNNPIVNTLLMQHDLVFAGEQGHNNIIDPHMEACYSQRYITIKGGRFHQILGGNLGQNEGQCNAFNVLAWSTGHAAIFIDSADGGSTSQAQLTDITIRDVHIHNTSQQISEGVDGPAPFIAIRHVRRADIIGNKFGVVACEFPILLAANTLEGSFRIRNNIFDGRATNRRPYLFINTSIGTQPILGRLVIDVSSNAADNFAEGFKPSPAIYSEYWPTGFGFETDPTLNFTSSANQFRFINSAHMDNTTGQPELKEDGPAASGDLDFIEVGDWIDIRTTTGNGINEGIRVVVGKTIDASGDIIEFEDMNYDFVGIGTLNLGDFFTETNTGITTIRVVKRGFNSNSNVMSPP